MVRNADGTAKFALFRQMSRFPRTTRDGRLNATKLAFETISRRPPILVKNGNDSEATATLRIMRESAMCMRAEKSMTDSCPQFVRVMARDLVNNGAATDRSTLLAVTAIAADDKVRTGKNTAVSLTFDCIDRASETTWSLGKRICVSS